MKKALALFAVVLTLGLTVMDAEAARRLGGGKSSGMQRQNVTQPNTPPANSANPGAPAGSTAAAPAAAGTAAAAAAAPKRSWMGPIAGLAAGLGLAALASHLGFGEAFANILMIALLAMAVLFVVGYFMRKRAQGQGQGPALAGAGNLGGGNLRQDPQAGGMFRSGQVEAPRQGGSIIGSRIGSGIATSPAVAAGAVGNIPADFDAAAFARNAKDQFMALQAANDAGDLQRLRDYLTPEMFEAVRADIQERGDAPLNTEVFGLSAQVLDVAQEADRYIVSVRFTGGVREEAGAAPEDLDEVWHLTKPRSGMGGWVIAGIQQTAA